MRVFWEDHVILIHWKVFFNLSKLAKMILYLGTGSIFRNGGSDNYFPWTKVSNYFNSNSKSFVESLVATVFCWVNQSQCDFFGQKSMRNSISSENRSCHLPLIIFIGYLIFFVTLNNFKGIMLFYTSPKLLVIGKNK